jgi:peptidyl-prolyl cis-trans isomerase A (cyclophilin A)
MSKATTRTVFGALALILTMMTLIPGARAAEPECFPDEVLPENMFPSVRLETSMGDIVIELNRRRAPVTANNFLRYVLAGAYDGTIFHRVMPGFVVQGGGYTEAIEERELFPPIINESGNGLRNLPMTVAMARFDDPHSATNQFFFNLADNSSLDPNSRSWGYAVFGDVVSGWDVVESIASVQTGYNELLEAENVPLVPVKILSATVMEPPH